ncbi:MAG: hypothetical protein WD872_14055 [Pirellulaceae bacterium]
MKASVQLLTGCVALGLTLPATLCQAAPLQAGVWATATASAGQFGKTDNRRAADDLLRQARKAIKAGDFAAADGLVTQAEKLGVTYDPLTARFVDTPEKLRQLLDETKSREIPAATLPSSRFPPLLTSPAAARPGGDVPKDPFSAAGRPGVVEQLATAGDKSKAAGLLRDARAALAAGDKLAALAAWQKAAGMPAQYGLDEDSPQKVAFDLQRAGVDPSRLVPVAANPAAPFAMQPSDVSAYDRLPALGASPAQLPAGANAPTLNPYGLPAESNPLAAAPQNVYQPAGQDSIYSPAAPQPYQAAPAQFQAEAPQRLPSGDPAKKGEAVRLVAQARIALDRGDLQAAHSMAQQAQDLNVPDNAYAAEETRPWQVLLDVEKISRRREGVVQASGANAPAEPKYPVAQGVYDPQADATRNVPASSQAPLGRAVPTPAGQAGGPGDRLYDEGLQALENGDREGALAKFGEAWKFRDQLDPAIAQQIKDKLTFMRAVQPLPGGGAQASPLEEVNSQQEVLRQKLQREVLNERTAAEKLAQSDPRAALQLLQKTRERVNVAELDPGSKKQLLTLVDRLASELATFIEQNKATIENDEQTAAIRADRQRSQDFALETQNKLAEFVEQFNKLMDEQRFAEAEVISRQALELAPREPVAVNMVEKARLARNIAAAYDVRSRKEGAFNDVLGEVDAAAVQNVGDDNPYVFDQKRWGDLSRSRRKLLGEENRLSPAEMEIQRSLGKLIEAKFDERPLVEVMDTLSKMAGINIYLDPQGLAAEGLTTDIPVSLNLTQPVTLRSALNLVLEPKGLSYVIQNEVLRITSRQTKDANTYAKVYYVADLVVPIPNFTPGYNVGLPAALRESMSALGYGGQISPAYSGPLTVNANEEQTVRTGAVPTSFLAQAGQSGMQTASGLRIPHSERGPGGLGGGVTADFTSLIDLITTTVAPTTWDALGGPGAIREFETNLSLVVSQTQDVHEQIADLLEQLRRLQDLQVTIEVRFITLSDRFFERIGVDFDFSIDDNTHLNNQRDQLPTSTGATTPPAVTALSSFFDDDNYSIGIGFTPTGPTADLDLKFGQGHFESTRPQFGNFQPSDAASFGFAILSDIEAFFVLEAAQGDDRANILQAPKVTMFNGQLAQVNDQLARPFVTQIVPVVADFAVAYQPVVTVLNEGTALSVQAVVSNDRRFVRLTLVPFFSQIGEVSTFTFNGKVTTDSGTVVQDPTDPDQSDRDNQTTTVEGTTVQLPTLAFTSVSTTVSVPDGGTVLLGGVKRLREGRNERGVPLLSKVPYISRLFRNVGIGRDANSLMMMVTPRIIIQEEEEEKLGIEVEN